MAVLHELSKKLNDFKNAYDGGFSKVNSAKSEVSTGITGVINSLDSVASKFSIASNDSYGKQLTSCVNLAKNGLNSVKSHVEGDIGQLMASAGELRGLIQQIDDLINQGKSWKEASTVVETKDDGTKETKQNKNDQDKIDQANAEIDNNNDQGEAMLDAMAAAMNGVSFGVIGNMKVGGSLGPSTSYSDNYNFVLKEFVYDDSKKIVDPNEPVPETIIEPVPETIIETVPETILEPKSSFNGAKEFDVLNLDAHKGDSKEICIPRNLREMKEAMKKEQPIILENCEFMYDYGGMGSIYYDCTDKRRYFIFDGKDYKEVDENGRHVNDGQWIIRDRIYGAADYSDYIQKAGASGFNDTALKYNGKQRALPTPEQTGNAKTTFVGASAGDSYEATNKDGSKIHTGKSSVISDPSTFRELKDAMANEQPIKLNGVKLHYDPGQGGSACTYDATSESIYLVKCADGYYRQVNADGNYVDENYKIDPNRIYEAGDTSENMSSINYTWINGTGFKSEKVISNIK